MKVSELQTWLADRAAKLTIDPSHRQFVVAIECTVTGPRVGSGEHLEEVLALVMRCVDTAIERHTRRRQETQS